MDKSEMKNAMDENTVEAKLWRIEQDVGDLMEQVDRDVPELIAGPINTVLDLVKDSLAALQDEVAPQDHVPPQEGNTEIAFIRVEGKCSDRCSIDFVSAEGGMELQHNGEVPDFMPGQHWGDSIILSINVASGIINNWGDEERKGLQAFVNEQKEKADVE